MLIPPPASKGSLDPRSVQSLYQTFSISGWVWNSILKWWNHWKEELSLSSVFRKLYPSPSQASTVHKPWTSRCSSWILKRQRNQRSNCQQPLDHRKSKRVPENIYFCFIDYDKAFDCVDHSKLENSSRDGNTRPPYLPPEKSVCSSRSRCLPGILLLFLWSTGYWQFDLLFLFLF